MNITKEEFSEYMINRDLAIKNTNIDNAKHPLCVLMNELFSDARLKWSCDYYYITKDKKYNKYIVNASNSSYSQINLITDDQLWIDLQQFSKNKPLRLYL